MYGAGDVRVENVPDPILQDPTDALVRIVRSCVCGSDLHPYHSMPKSHQGSPMGHEFIGVIEETGKDVATLPSAKAASAGVQRFYWGMTAVTLTRTGLAPTVETMTTNTKQTVA